MKKLLHIAVICILFASCARRIVYLQAPQGYPQGRNQAPQNGAVITPGVQLVPFSPFCNATIGMLQHPPVDNVKWDCTFASDGSSNCTVSADDAGIEVIITELNGGTVNQIVVHPSLYTNPGIGGLARRCFTRAQDGRAYPKHTYPRPIRVWRVASPAYGWVYYCDI